MLSYKEKRGLIIMLGCIMGATIAPAIAAESLWTAGAWFGLCAGTFGAAAWYFSGGHKG